MDKRGRVDFSVVLADYTCISMNYSSITFINIKVSKYNCR